MGGPGFQEFVLEKPEHSPHYRYDLLDNDKPSTHRPHYLSLPHRTKSVATVP